jgi:hypothetical protein
MSDDGRNVERKPSFEHVCVIEGLLLGDVPTEQFERELGAMLGVRVQYLETVLTLPDHDDTGAPVPETGGRSDVLFAYHRDDYSAEFNARRVARRIRWFEDAISPRNNPNGIIYPERVCEYVDPAVRELMAIAAAPARLPPASFPDHEWLGSMRVGEALVLRDAEAQPLRLTLHMMSGRWHAWLRRSEGTAVALLLVHEENLTRAREPIEVFFGQHAVAVGAIVRGTSPELMGLMPDVQALMAKLTSSDDRELVRLAHRNESEFVNRWNRGPITVMVHDDDGVTAAPPTDLSNGVGALKGGGFWARTTGQDGWCVVGVENEDDLAVVVRVNLSGKHDHNYLIDSQSADLAAKAADLPKPTAGTAPRRYSTKERYAVGDVLEHATFGTGHVVEVLVGNKVRALFDSGAKLLAHGR